jgi:hypothetical protein
MREEHEFTMTTKTIDVIAGHVVPDVSALDLVAAKARKAEVQALLGATRDNPARAAERAALRAEDAAIAARLGELKEAEKRENTRRTFAGIGSPLHEAIVARLDPTTVALLEQDALSRLAERERRSAERKAAKAAKDGG